MAIISWIRLIALSVMVTVGPAKAQAVDSAELVAKGGCPGCDLELAELRHIHLRDADFARAPLREADLKRAMLAGANFQGADLQRAEMEGALVAEADFSDASLRGDPS